ncbi:MAG: sigma-54 dependent transcriptional regulator [Balneolaceae bacterium]|nr:sigma-54 dependent transcriptional regulator [Balneolaceae bacterium]
MEENGIHILVTDDEKSIRNSLRDILEFEDYTVSIARNGQESIRMLKEKQIDLMLLDIKMQGMDGIEVLEKIRDEGYEFPVIMISGHGNIEIAVKATKLGAFDFIEKPPDLNRLLISVRNAIEQHNLKRENKSMRSKLPGAPEIVGQSQEIEEIKQKIEKVAPTNSRVFITGENGTGKELVARSIHEKSKRKNGPFVDVNCAAIPSELLESELFGHEEGAFTGATSRRIGKFEQANRGTLFMDEIGDMSIDAQAKVLRALQENTVTRVGGTEKIKVDVRVIAATNKDLLQEIDEGNFREDLYHRINVLPIHVPPLRERREDIPLLAKHCLEMLSKDDIVFSEFEFSDEALEELKKLSWSGNVRELQNMVERLGLLVEGKTITAEDVKMMASGRTVKSNNVETELIENEQSFQDFKEAAERLFLIQKLEENDWNISADGRSYRYSAQSHV